MDIKKRPPSHEKEYRNAHDRQRRQERYETEVAEKEAKLAAEGKLAPVETHFADPAVGPLAVERTEMRLRRIGRNVIYDRPEQMVPVIQEFFEYCIATEQPPLVTTLALALGFCTRATLDDYMKKPAFTDIIKRAKLVCEDYAAKGLLMGKNVVGFIFLLKQYGWKDVQETITTIETHEQRIDRLIKQNMGGDRG